MGEVGAEDPGVPARGTVDGDEKCPGCPVVDVIAGACACAGGDSMSGREDGEQPEAVPMTSEGDVGSSDSDQVTEQVKNSIASCNNGIRNAEVELMGMKEEKGGSLSIELGNSAGNDNLETCCEVNPETWHEVIGNTEDEGPCVDRGSEFNADDIGHMHDTSLVPRKGSREEHGHLVANEGEGGSFSVELGNSAETDILETCHEVNGGVDDKGSCASCGSEFNSDDIGHVGKTPIEPKEESQKENGHIVAKGDIGKTIPDDRMTDEALKIADNEHLGVSVGSSNLKISEGEGSPRGGAGIGSKGNFSAEPFNEDNGCCMVANASCGHGKDGFLPKFEGEIATPLNGFSVPSISDGCIVESEGPESGGVGIGSEGGSIAEPFNGGNGCSMATNPSCRQGKEGFLAMFDEAIRTPVDESSIPSISDVHIDASVGGKAGQLGMISESHMDMFKQACVSEKECENECREECYNEVNQDFISQISQVMNLESTEANREQSEAYPNDPLDKKRVSLQQTDGEDGSPNLPLEKDSTSSSQVQPCEEPPCCSGEESSAQHQSNPASAGVECGPSGHSFAPEFYKDVSNFANPKACSGDLAENVDSGESANRKLAPLIVFRRRNPKRAASSRNTQSHEKPDQLNKARNGAGKCRKAVGSSTLLLSSMIKIPNKATKRRSCLRRQEQQSVWGSLENLIDSFSQNCGLSASDSDPTWLKYGTSKKRRSSGGKKQQCHRKARSLRVPKNKFAVPSEIQYAKDALKLQSIFPVMVDSNVSLETGDKEHIPNLDCHAPRGISGEYGKPSQSNEDRCVLKLKSFHIDGQQLERDLESTVTQETYSADIPPSEGPGLSSSGPLLKNANGTVVSDPGSSPDSVVYNPVLEVGSVACEINTPASRDVVVNESLLVRDVAAEGLHAAVLSTCKSAVNSDSSLDLEQQIKTERGNNSMKYAEASGPSCAIENRLGELKSQAPENHNTVTKSKSLSKHGRRKRDGLKEKSCKSKISNKVSSRKGSKCRTFSNGLSVFVPAELSSFEASPNSVPCLETAASTEQDVGRMPFESENLESSFIPDNIKGDVPTNGTTPKLSKHRKKDSSGRRKLKEQKLDIKGENKKKSQIRDNSQEGCASVSFTCGSAAKLASSRLTEMRGKLSPAGEVVCKDSIFAEVPSEAACGLDVPSLPPRVAWVCCDDCQKWRCIPAALADVIGETSCRWTCKDNEDKSFADCSIPQEKTNAEINAELELSDASCDEGCNTQANSKASRPASWTHIRSNIFLHRNRRTQSIDESMVCECKPPEEGRMGCRGGCLNRMLNIECVKRTCPCGDLCSNQQFQRRNYAKLRRFQCGKKGYGLQLLENVSEGQFLIEYVGEVLGISAYESRQRYYASRGQKHFYFMALNGGEVIDACTKGNLGRFINHSCSPNCRTEKWIVNGEVCIGIFAIRNIKKGEELTFDYNYVRVSGAAPQKCFCGSAECRGYIGGDLLGADVIVQGDPDAENFEHMDVDIDAGKETDAIKVTSHGVDLNLVQHEETSTQNEEPNQWSPAIPELIACQQTGGTSSDISEPDASLQALSPQEAEEIIHTPVQEAEEIIRTPVHVSQTLDSSMHCLHSVKTEGVMARPISVYQTSELLQEVSNPVNEPTPSGSTIQESNVMSDSHGNKQNRLKRHNRLKSSPSIDATMNDTTSAKTCVLLKDKRMSTDTGSEHFLGVEERLNKLLDSDGGISKRKDATNGYLKLLLMTAAEGDNAGGTSKSVRDLSMILDALLKTKSHKVLLDILNKNGLQMLHNILKQNRSNFHRIPIIRKLLKVLEFLALKGILTPEHINRGPRCTGMESFKDSMLSLTRHNDTQVHQIARNFRDKWIPRTIAIFEPTDREEEHSNSQRNYFNRFQASSVKCPFDQGRRDSDAIVCVNAATYEPISSYVIDFQGGISSHDNVPILTSPCSAGAIPTTRRKRKSRWDQPSDDNNPHQYPQALPNHDYQSEAVCTKFQKACSEHMEFGSRIEVLKSKFERENFASYSEVSCMRGSTGDNADEEVPPGFGSLQKGHLPQVPLGNFSDAGEVSQVSTGYLQEIYQPHLSISYGIPVPLVQQFGTPEVKGGNQCHKSWSIAPGVPFHPFPPLPPYPRGEPCPSTISQSYDGNQMCSLANGTPVVRHNNSEPCISTPGERLVVRNERVHRSWRTGGRVRWFSNCQGRRFPRQWSNNHKFQRYWPPWPREHGESGCRGRDRATSFGSGKSSSDTHGNSCSPKV